jgi:hypothetical protein
MSRHCLTFFTFTILIGSHILIAQNAASISPRVELSAAPRLRLTGEADSNSPAAWRRVDGLNQMLVLTSTGGRPSAASGLRLDRLSVAIPVVFEPWPQEGVWMEAVIPDVDGTLYGYYHGERLATVCPGSAKMIPRIGAARSNDHGLTWELLGTVLEAPPGSHDCETNNQYFVGGVGDFSVQLDPASRDLYFFYSQYIRWDRFQGIGVARLSWADRDAPSGKAMVYGSGSWFPARAVGLNDMRRWIYPASIPILPATKPWHDDDLAVDVFWGPSVHWNTYLGQYVMLLNRARDASWSQEGIYVSFAPHLDDPSAWTAPVKIMAGGKWYPQVMGIEDGSGTDKVAGRWARFFVGGVSDHLIQFVK